MHNSSAACVGTVLPYRNIKPKVAAGVFLAGGSFIIGDVELGEGCSIWYNTVLRGDIHYIRVGSMSNIQDACIGHVGNGTHPLIIGNSVTVGHRAVLHGCTVEDLCLIGIGAVVLDGAVVERQAMVAAGAVVTPGTRVASGTLFGGVPARAMRDLTVEELANLAASAERYYAYAATTQESLRVL